MNEPIDERVDRGIGRAERLYENHGRVFRALWIVVAAIIVLAGVAMTVLPGPVTLVVPTGLAMLAAAFGWARRLLLASVRKGVDVKDRAEDVSTKAKVLGAVAVACLAAAALGLYLLW